MVVKLKAPENDGIFMHTQVVMRRPNMALIFEQDLEDTYEDRCPFTEDQQLQWSTDGLACFSPQTKAVLRFDSASDLLSKLEIFSKKLSFGARMSPCSRMIVCYGATRLHCSLQTSAFVEVTASGGGHLLASRLSNVAWHPCAASGCCFYAVVRYVCPALLLLVDACKNQDVAQWPLSDICISGSKADFSSSCRLVWSSDGRRLCLVNKNFINVFSFH